MAIKFDPKVVPVTGARVADYREQFEVDQPSWAHEVHQCPGCDHQLYLMVGAVGRVRPHFPNRELLVMCDECAEPWIQRIARKGGALMAPTKSDRTHFDRVLAARTQQSGAN